MVTLCIVAKSASESKTTRYGLLLPPFISLRLGELTDIGELAKLMENRPTEI